MSSTDEALSVQPSVVSFARGRARIVDTQSFVFWVAVAATLWSATRLFDQITSVPTVQALPAVAWFALVAWGAYAAGFFALVLHFQVFVRRAPAVLAAAFVWGGVTAATFAAKANAALSDILMHVLGTGFDEKWRDAIVAATNEESLKVLGVVVLALLPLVAMRSVLDGLFYGAVVGLGFQVVEDFIYTVQQSGSISDAGEFLVQRGLLAGVFAHASYTAITGVGVGYFIARRDRGFGNRLAVAVGAFLFAWVVHVLWDAPLWEDLVGDGSGAFWITLAIKGLPTLIGLIVLFRWAARQDGTVWSSTVRDQVDPSLITPDEVVSLSSRKQRKLARKAAHAAGGRHAAAVCRELQEAQLRYVQTVEEEGAASSTAERWAQRIGALRPMLSAG